MKKWSLLLLIMFIIISVPTATKAAKWERIGERFSTRWSMLTTVYIDTESISGDPSGPKEAWAKMEFKPPHCMYSYIKTATKCYAAADSYARYFNNKTFCVLRDIAYYTDGTNETSRLECVPRNFEPGDINELKWNFLYK